MRPATVHRGCIVLAFAAAAAGLPARAQEQGEQAQPSGEGAGDLAPASAETEPAPTPSGILVYAPTDFARYAPRSALDMLQQVPGFTIEQGFGQDRGFGEATGNVLLNGERISSKSDSIIDQLNRIPAGNVVRIELIDGATLDIPGLSGRVANVVARSTGISGQFEWQPQLATDYASTRLFEARASVSGASGPVAYTVAAANEPFHGGTGGPNFITDSTGLAEERFNFTHSVNHNPKLSGTLRIDGPGNSVANVNASIQWTRDRGRETEFVVAAPEAPSAIEQIESRGDGHNYEIGGDYEFGLGPGRLKLIALESHRRSDFSIQSVIDPDTGDPATGGRFTLASQSGERIGRAQYAWTMLGGDWQLSAEAAFNRLDNVAGLAILTQAGEFAPIPFPAGTGGVTEDRYETILSFGRPLTSTLSLQASVGGEYSTIAQTGPNALSRTFKRPKGSISLAWAPREGLDVSLKLARDVGQLDFNDFLADVNLQNDNTNAANNQLRPEQSWEFDFEVAKSLGAWGSLTLHYFDNRISDYVTIVPLPGGGEAVGNIDSARIHGMSLTGTIRLDPLGVRGAKFDIEADVRDSALIDPVTGREIEFRFPHPRDIEIDFRHDVPGTDWAWGGGLRHTEFNPYYRTAEFGFDYNIRNNLRLFIEHKDVFGLTVQARINNILEGKQVLDRVVYAGPRGASPTLFRENRRREVGRIINLTIKGSF